MSQDLTRVLRASVLPVASKVATVALSLATGVVVSRVLGPEGKGALSYVSTATNLAARFASLGLESSFTRFHRAQGRALAVSAGTVTWATLALGVGAAIVLEALIHLWPGVTAGVPLLLARAYFWAMPLLLFQFVVGYLLFGMQRELMFSGLDAGLRVAMLVATVIGLWAFSFGVIATGLIQLVVTLAFAVVGLVVVARIAGALPWDGGLARLMIADSGRYFAYSVARYGLSYGSTLLSAQLLGLHDTGIFSIALMLAETVFLLVGTVNLAFYPAVATARDPLAYTRGMAWRMLVAGAAASAILAAAGAVVVPRLYGPQFAEAVPVFLWLVPGVLVLCAEQSVSSYFVARTSSWAPAVAMLVGVALLPPAALALVPRLGLAGLALASSAAQGAAGVTAALAFRRVQPAAAISQVGQEQ